MGMAFTLADRLGAKSSPCSVPGCTRTWLSMASAQKKVTAKLGGRGEPSADDLLSVWIRPNNEHGVAPGQTMYFDDIYLDPTAVNMTDPTAAFPPD